MRIRKFLIIISKSNFSLSEAESLSSQLVSKLPYSGQLTKSQRPKRSPEGAEKPIYNNTPTHTILDSKIEDGVWTITYRLTLHGLECGLSDARHDLIVLSTPHTSNNLVGVEIASKTLKFHSG